jgi:hypothetical protein
LKKIELESPQTLMMYATFLTRERARPKART